MPVELSFDGDGSVFGSCNGTATGQELIDANDIIYSDEHIHQMAYQLWDFTGAERFNISNKKIHRIADQDVWGAKINPHFIVAVVGDDDLIIGLARMWENITESKERSFESKVFRSIEEANKWINSKGNQSA